MKTIILFIIGVFTLQTVSAQNLEKPSDVLKKHEISIDFLESLLGKFEGSYDYILNDMSSIGASISISPNSVIYNDFKEEKFSLNFNYKMYFSKKRAQGFYVEFLTEYANGNRYKYDYYNGNFNSKEPYNNLNVGFNLGYKYVNKHNYFINVAAGLSRTIVNFNKNNGYYSGGFKPNFTLSIGKRF